jgi:virulence-associated protein VagC
MLILIQGGSVIDPGHLDTVADILIKDHKIVEIIAAGQKEAIEPVSRIIDATSISENPAMSTKRPSSRAPEQPPGGDLQRSAPCRTPTR